MNWNAQAFRVVDGGILVDGQDHITGPWVPILRLAHRTDVDGVAESLPSIALIGEYAVIRLVRMSEAEDVRVRTFEDAHHALLVAVLEKVFVDLAGAAMHEQHVQLVVVQLVLQPNVSWQSS